MRDSLLIRLFLAFVCACAPTATSTPTPDAMAGDYLVEGGGAAAPVFNALADGFRAHHPSAHFAFQDVGSAAGLRLVASGTTDLATSSVTPPPEIAPTVRLVPVGARGTAVIVNALNPVNALSKAQVRDMFAGAVATWSAFGGPAMPILVGVREPTSALRANFEAYFFGGAGTYARGAIELHSTDEVIAAVAGRFEVVAMVTADSRLRSDPRVRALVIDGVAPTQENIASGRYPVRRQLFLAYNPTAARPGVTAFIAFVQSEEGQRIIERVATSSD